MPDDDDRLRNTYAAVREVATHPADHEAAIRAAYEAVLRPGSIAVDGGAHSGKHTIPMAQAVGPDGAVYAFEPSPEPRSRLEKAIAAAGLTNVIISSCGLSKPPARELTFLVFPDRPGVSGFERRTDAVGELAAEEIRVQTTTLDADLGDVPDLAFMKLDVEGAELDAMFGAEALLKAHRPLVHIEASHVSWTPFGYGPIELFAFLAALDYAVIDVVGSPIPDAHTLDVSFKTAGVWDYLLLPQTARGMLAREAISAHASATYGFD